MIIIPKTGKTNSSHGIQIEGLTSFKVDTSIEYKRKNLKVFFTVTDTSKFQYEKGYKKEVSRKVTLKDNKMTFKYNTFTYDFTAAFDCPEYTGA